MKLHMQIPVIQTSLALLIGLVLVATKTGRGQNIPLYNGELTVVIENSSTALSISAVVSGNVGGSRCDHYAITHDYDSRSGSTSGSWYLEQLDKHGCPARTGTGWFAYGAYTITIQNHSIVMDYRDADYENGGGDYAFGTGYNTADMVVYYNSLDGVFYKHSNCDTAITSGYIAIWQDGRKDGSVPVKVPGTITNSFGGGQVTVDGETVSIPEYVKWNNGSSHSFAAITPQVFNYLNYGFTGWSDGSSSQSRSITAALSQFGTAYTANFSVTSPQRVTNFTAGGSIGSNPHLSWTAHGNSDVNYYVYRKVRHNGVTGAEELLATLSHGTTSYDDPDWKLVGLSTYLLYYDVRAHHTPSGTFADPFWLGAGYGVMYRETAPDEALGESTHPDRKPEPYALSAHPNPFNPQTQITFDLPVAGRVTLTVYDMAGREVATLVNGFRAVGSHQVSWNAASSSSGIYLVCLRAMDELGQATFEKVHKLLLVK